MTAPHPFSVVDEIACYFDSAAEPINVHIELWLPGRLDAERLREAVSAVLADQPRTRARRAAGGWWSGRYTWEFPAGADVDPVSTACWRTEAELDSARVRFLATAPPIDRSPPFRLLLASGPEWDSLILNAHHVAFDGRSCLRLLRLIGDQYSACDTQERSGPTPSASGPGLLAEPTDPTDPTDPTGPTGPTEPTEPTEPTGPTEPTEPTAGPRWPLANLIRSATCPPARIARERAAGRWPQRAPGYGAGLLSWPDVPSAPAAADGPAGTAGNRHRVTVNDVLIAALIQAIVGWNATRCRRRKPVRITMPVDTRPPGGQDELGNLSRLCTITAAPWPQAQANAAPWPQAQANAAPRPPAQAQAQANAASPSGADPSGAEAGVGAEDLTTVVATQTWRAKRQPGPKEDPALALLARTRLPTSIKRRLVRLAIRSVGRLECDTSLLSNLGKVTDPPRFGMLSPTRIWFSTSAHIPRGLSVGAVTIEGRLQLCFRYRYALLDDAAAREFVAGYAEALSALARRAR